MQNGHGKIVASPFSWLVLLRTENRLPISTIDKPYPVRHYGCGHFVLPSRRGMDVGNWRDTMYEFIHRLWREDAGQDIAEYAVMLAVILVLVVGTIRLIGSNANNAFSSVASSLQ
jgi:Flp pilus assembly pilin Flp